MTYVLNMNLKFFHITELLHNCLVTLLTVLPCQLWIPVVDIIRKNICAKFGHRILSFSWAIVNLPCSHGNSMPKVTNYSGSMFYPKDHIFQI